MSDLIDRQTAIETAIEAADKWDGGYSSEREGIIRKFFDKVPAVQPDHVADSGKKVCVDTISRQAALKKLAVYIHLIDKTMGKGLLTDDDCMEAAKSVLGEDELPAVQPATSCSEIPNGSDDTISRRAAIDAMKDMYRAAEKWLRDTTDDVTKARAESCMASLVEIKLRTEKLPAAQPEWNNHTVACLLAELFNDTCACNYNDIDEWLPKKCELLDSCPNPVGVACWEQFLKHRAERRTDEQTVSE